MSDEQQVQIDRNRPIVIFKDLNGDTLIVDIVKGYPEELVSSMKEFYHRVMTEYKNIVYV